MNIHTKINTITRTTIVVAKAVQRAPPDSKRHLCFGLPSTELPSFHGLDEILIYSVGRF